MPPGGASNVDSTHDRDARLDHEAARPKSAREPWQPSADELRPDRPFADLEDLTAPFRHERAARHSRIARECRLAYHDALSVWDPTDAADDVPATTTEVVAEYTGALVTRELWHRRRSRGQRHRFNRVRGCGARVFVATCRGCGHAREPRPEGCGVARVCMRCSLSNAKERRARFGRARGRVILDSVRAGLTRRVRKNGRYTEKMLTLTVPHAMLAECTGLVREKATSDLEARIVALFAAWPRFLRFVNRAFKKRNEPWVKYHRAFEWTPGNSDTHGHPHFHVYLWCPFIPFDLLRGWWGQALSDVGFPVAIDEDGRFVTSVRIGMVKDFDHQMVTELMKGGKRAALTLSRLEAASESRDGSDVYEYSEGWTIADVYEMCAPDVVARLYCALEGRRLSQASQRFFVDDPPCSCASCGGEGFFVRFEPIAEESERAERSREERGPP